MEYSVPIAITVVGLVLAIAFALPSILAFVRERRSQSGIYELDHRLSKAGLKLDELARQSELSLSCFEAINSALAVQRSAFSELITNQNANWDNAHKIFSEQDIRIRRAILHLQLEARSPESRQTAAHILATELGNGASIVHMKNSLIGLNDLEKKLLERRIDLLAKRLDKD